MNWWFNGQQQNMLALNSEGIPLLPNEIIIEFLKRYEGARSAYPQAYALVDQESKERLDEISLVSPDAFTPDINEHDFSDMLQRRDARAGIIDINRIRMR